MGFIKTVFTMICKLIKILPLWYAFGFPFKMAVFLICIMAVQRFGYDVFSHTSLDLWGICYYLAGILMIIVSSSFIVGTIRLIAEWIVGLRRVGAIEQFRRGRARFLAEMARQHAEEALRLANEANQLIGDFPHEAKEEDKKAKKE